jgi:hypothetical protein
MAAGFDIHDRGTWAWKDDSDGIVRLDDRFALNKDDPHSFYQYGTDGRPYLHQCPIKDADGNRLTFDPRLMACDWLDASADADIYDWAVSSGLVADQR